MQTRLLLDRRLGVNEERTDHKLLDTNAAAGSTTKQDLELSSTKTSKRGENQLAGPGYRLYFELRNNVET